MQIVKINVHAASYDDVYDEFFGMNEEAAYRQFKNTIKEEGQRLIEEVRNENGDVSEVTTNQDIYYLLYYFAEVEE